MSKILPKPGTYTARRNKPIVVNETTNGALMAWVDYKLLNADVAFNGVHTIVLGKTDGTLMTKAFESLHKVFPDWKTNDPFELVEIPIPDGDGAEFELADCYIDDTYVPANSQDGQPVLQFKARWFNSLESSRLPVVEASEVEEIKSKWSGKWNSLGGASKAQEKAKPTSAKASKPAAEKPVEKPADKPVGPTRKAPAKASKQYASAQEVYDAMQKKNNGEKSEDELSDVWFAAQDELFGEGKEAANVDEFNKLAAKLGL